MTHSSEERPFVFVIMPFDAQWTELYERGIKVACEDAGADCERVDEQIYAEGMLDRIYSQLEQASVVVAEMTDSNPNVYYEAGYAHGLRKPVIFLTRSADQIPFDLKHYRHIVHADDIAETRRKLTADVKYYLDHPEAVAAAMDRRGTAERADMDLMADHIEGYLNRNGIEMATFEIIRENVDEEYSEELVKRLIRLNPQRFHRARLRGGRPGIGLVRR